MNHRTPKYQNHVCIIFSLMISSVWDKEFCIFLYFIDLYELVHL
uniref:Uncharacterized protein n=1 Tax=Rhizophora mucronata TaxID=61149 RepID=A0A2P2QHA6_RHIMU